MAQPPTYFFRRFHVRSYDIGRLPIVSYEENRISNALDRNPTSLSELAMDFQRFGIDPLKALMGALTINK